MKKEIPLGTQSKEVLEAAGRLRANMCNRSKLGDITNDLLFLATANHLTHPDIPALIIDSLKSAQPFLEGEFEDLLMQVADKVPSDSKLSVQLAAEWTDLHAYASLEEKAVKFPDMLDAFKLAKNVNMREAAGHQILATCFQHATSDAKLIQIKDALTDVRAFAADHERKQLLHATSAKITDLRKQERDLERSLV